ncbi:hypothetical protein [Roseibium sp. MMSF_3412]|uniref:hypothetical protein n=1 Tax=Roseibium sp. MMSF_3412 TaxID=3046712 RepID=UPI00273D745E|nr:hypothetical protein [Roseibium sp. MMSF_3412]
MPTRNTPLKLTLALAFLLAPAAAADLPLVSDAGVKAFAKNGNGNSNGNGNGNGGGNGNANGGGNGSGGGNGVAGNSNRTGNSASKTKGNNGFGLLSRGNGKKQSTRKNGNGKGLNGFLNTVFGEKSNGRKQTTARRQVSNGGGKAGSYRLPKAERATLASVSAMPAVSPRLKEKNLNARLGRLNSLRRNYNAYINSKDPHLASVVAYVGASIEFQKASEELASLSESVAAVRETLLGSVDPAGLPEDFDISDLKTQEIADQVAEKITALETQIAELEALDDTDLPDDAVPVSDQINALQAQIDTLNGIVDSQEFADLQAAENDVAQAEANVAGLEDGVSDEALREALAGMINDNRVDAIDDEMVDWARDILDGKTEEIRNATEKPDTADTPVDDTPIDDLEETAALPSGSEPTEDDLRFNRIN